MHATISSLASITTSHRYDREIDSPTIHLLTHLVPICAHQRSINHSLDDFNPFHQFNWQKLKSYFKFEPPSVHSRISLEPPIFDNLSNFATFFSVFCSKKGLEPPIWVAGRLWNEHCRLPTFRLLSNGPTRCMPQRNVAAKKLNI